MKMTITTLAENTVRRPGLIAKHGLSFLIQTDRGTVLFDTGQGYALIHNAARLDVDLGKVDRIVLSHGHFDHTGGLRQVLGRIGPREVFAHPDALRPKYSVREGRVWAIGIPGRREDLEEAGATFRLSESPAEILPGIVATGRIPRTSGFEQVGAHFRAGPEKDSTQDLLRDDQALIVETGEGPVVVLGCAHAGLVNTLFYAAELAGGRKFAGVIGGTHLIDADESRLRRTVETLGAFEIGRMAACHCTEFRGQVALYEAFGKRFVPHATGDRIEFG